MKPNSFMWGPDALQPTPPKRWLAEISYRSQRDDPVVVTLAVDSLAEIDSGLPDGHALDTVIDILVTRINHSFSDQLTLENLQVPS